MYIVPLRLSYMYVYMWCICMSCQFQEGQSALYQATFYGHHDVVEALVDAKADVDTSSEVSPYLRLEINAQCST